MSKIEIVSGDGKYHTTFDNGHLTITRHGEPWRDETGDGYILSLVQRIEELESLYASATECYLEQEQLVERLSIKPGDMVLITWNDGKNVLAKCKYIDESSIAFAGNGWEDAAELNTIKVYKQ